LFAKTWVNEVGITTQTIDKKVAMKGFGFGIFFSVLGFFSIALLLLVANIKCRSSLASFGFHLAMLIILQMATNFIYEGRSKKLFLINTSYIR
jgi:hypothetical protein